MKLAIGKSGGWLLMLVFPFHSPSIPDEWVVSLSLSAGRKQTEVREG